MPTQRNYTKIKRLTVFSQEKDLQKFLETNFTESLKQMIRYTIKTMVKQEMELLRKKLEEKPCFNGYYDRHLLSSYGRIKNVPIPRFRQSLSDSGFKLQTLNNVFEGEKDKFMKLIEQMHLLGISQRKIKYLAKICFGIPLSTTRVGAVYKQLVEKEEFNLNQQPITDDYQYLLLDGIWEKTKGYGWESNKSVLICALGIKANQERKILGFLLARQEDTSSWKKLLGQLKQRGLKGKSLKLIITDDKQATKNAVQIFFPKAPLQNCIVHKMRNVFRKTSWKNKKAVIEDVKLIFKSEDQKEATDKAKTVVKKWYLNEPAAMESLRFNLEYCFTHFSFPKDIWSKIRTTNVLEREFREIRRRMKGFDNTFQNQESGERYANSIINYLNQNYPFSRGGLHTNA
jgi:putative transposase